jgi:prophage antirepressor-like protein
MKPTLFKFQEHSVRVVQIEGKPWFVAADACRALSLNADKRGVGKYLIRLMPEERNTAKLLGGIHAGNPNVIVISESGLYKLIMRSDKPEARKFQDWVTQEVLPAFMEKNQRVFCRKNPCCHIV